jgi:hypothetical protein
MIEPTGREILKSIIEGEINFLKGVLRPVGNYYHDFIGAYRKDDRGLRKATDITLYLEDLWPIFVDNRTKVSFRFPYVRKETEIIRKLTKEIEEINQLIKEVVNERTTLYPEEFAKLVYYFQNFRLYMDYVAGRDYLTLEMLEGKAIIDVLRKFRPIVEAFVRKVISNDDSFSNFYMGRIEEYSFLTLFTVDAYDNSLLIKLTEAKGEVEKENILKEYSPLIGLEKILFSVEKEIIDYNRKTLRERMERKNLCLPRGSLSQRIKIIDRGLRFSSYVKEIYGRDLFYIM